MSCRDSWSEERRAIEREKSRARMARAMLAPEKRKAVYVRRKERLAEAPELRESFRRGSAKYAAKMLADPEFKAKRAKYLKEWRGHKRDDLKFEAYVSALEALDTSGEKA